MNDHMTIAALQNAATQKISSGDFTIEELQNFLTSQSSPNRIIRSFDVYADGRVLKHIATEKEAIEYASRCADFEELIEKMSKGRETYSKQVNNAEKARAGKEEKKQAAKEAQVAKETEAEQEIQAEQVEC